LLRGVSAALEFGSVDRLLLEILPNPESFVHADFGASGLVRLLAAPPIKCGWILNDEPLGQSVQNAKFNGKSGRESTASIRHRAGI